MGPPGFDYLKDDQTVVFYGRNLEAMLAAERWLAERGFSIGRCQRGEPRAILRGFRAIPKWTRLGNILDDLDGIMTSADMRAGPVVIRLRADVEIARSGERDALGEAPHTSPGAINTVTQGHSGG